MVWTDHKALVPLFNNPSSNLSTKMERWMLRKQAFDMTIQYLPGAWNAADYLSRHPEKETAMKISKQAKVAEQYVNMVVGNIYTRRSGSRRIILSRRAKANLAGER